MCVCVVELEEETTRRRLVVKCVESQGVASKGVVSMVKVGGWLAVGYDLCRRPGPSFRVSVGDDHVRKPSVLPSGHDRLEIG
jgi:hypothetical protein